MRQSSRTLPLLLVFLSALWGCAHVRPPMEAPAGRPALKAESLRASAVVETKKGLLAVSGRANVAAKAPGSFRIEVAGPFGSPVALLVSDGAAFQAVSNGGIERHGWDEPGLSDRFRAVEVVALLLGGDPPADGKDAVAIRDGSGQLVRFSRLKDGAEIYSATLSDYREVDGAHIPFNITIEDTSGMIRIRYTSVEVNPLIDDGIFALEELSGPSAK